MTEIYLPYRAANASPRRLLTRAFETLRLWRQRVKGRAALARMNAHELADIGIDAGRRSHELSKPFWRG